MKPIKSDIVEEICPACNGTGFLPVIKQPRRVKGFTRRAVRGAVARVELLAASRTNENRNRTAAVEPCGRPRTIAITPVRRMNAQTARGRTQCP